MTSCPMNDELDFIRCLVHIDDDLFNQRADNLFFQHIGCRRMLPDATHIGG